MYTGTVYKVQIFLLKLCCVYQIDSPFKTEYYKINRYLRKMNDKLDKTFFQTILIAMLLYFNVINININMNIRNKNFPQIKACIL